MPNLSQTIRSLAEEFATQVVGALRSHSLDEILGEKAARSVMAAAKSAKPANGGAKKSGDVSVDAIVSILKKHRGGVRAEVLRKTLGVSKPKMGYHIAKALEAKKIRKTGTRRATTYFAR